MRSGEGRNTKAELIMAPNRGWPPRAAAPHPNQATPTSLKISAASLGIGLPSATASKIAARAGPTSAQPSILGKSKGLERRTGASLSRTILAAVMSPLRAAVKTALTIFFRRRLAWCFLSAKQRRLVSRALWLPGGIAGLGLFEIGFPEIWACIFSYGRTHCTRVVIEDSAPPS